MFAFALLAVPHGIGWLIAVGFALLVGINVATTGVIGGAAVRTFTANAAAMSKGLAVVSVTDDNHVAIAGANVTILGIIDESTINIGDAIGIVESGECYAVIGAAVSIGQWLVTDGSGRLIPSTNTGDNVVAQAKSSGSSAGDFIVVQVGQFQKGGVSTTNYFVAAGAIPVAPGTADLGSAGALAMTLATPTTPAQDGVSILIRASTAHAHTVTATANKIVTTNATYDTITFAHVGDSIELRAVGGVWQVVVNNGTTLSEV